MQDRCDKTWISRSAGITDISGLTMVAICTSRLPLVISVSAETGRSSCAVCAHVGHESNVDRNLYCGSVNIVERIIDNGEDY